MKRFATAGLAVLSLGVAQLSLANPMPDDLGLEPIPGNVAVLAHSIGMSYGGELVAPIRVVTDARLAPGLRPGDSLNRLQTARASEGASADCTRASDDRCERWTSSIEEALTPIGGESSWASTISPDGSLSFLTGSSVLGIRTAAVRSADGSGVWKNLWPGLPGGPGGTPRDIAASRDGSAVFVTGAIGTYRDVPDIATIAYDGATGEELWSQIFVGPQGGPDLGYSVEVSPDGSVVLVTGQAAPITGTIFAGQGDAVVLAYDAGDGDLLWSSVPGGAGHEYAIAATFIGDAAYVLGVGIKPGTSQYDVNVTRYRVIDGTPVWSVWNGWAGNETPWGIVADPDGDKLFITMVSNNPVAPWGADFGTVALDATTGSEMWRNRFSGDVPGGVNIPTSIAIGPELEEGAAAGDVRVYVSGLVTDTRIFDYDFGTVAYDGETGARIWVSQYGSERDEQIWDTALSPDGRHVYITGRDGQPYGGGASGGIPVNAATMAIDAVSGSLSWIARFQGAFGGSAGDPAGVDVTLDGATVVTSTTLIYPTDAGTLMDPADMVALGYDAL